ncbi:Serine/threonine-protein kinase ATM [Platanthera zijinensis]|uniref:Serine/threonine-protein kinase ATM n=1 Tax=Platanthera zijinensis TaxID=2320716 RepID=A0AAP0FU75_9ASPA
MATSRDVREIISKLSSDKSKTRDEGIRLLNNWLEGESSISFCRLLAKNTAGLVLLKFLTDESWPFLVTLLTKCIALEISASKKRHPKLLLAKTLRLTIQCAEDPKLSGIQLPLGSVIKVLFNHIWDVAKDVSAFHLEYSGILRHLLSVNEYRHQMRSRMYCSFLLLYMNKVVSAVSKKGPVLSSSKEEAFRCSLTLHVLLENPPGDFQIISGQSCCRFYRDVLIHKRDEGKYSRKLMECINTYLLKDGPNLGDLATDIHLSVQEFLFRFWLTTHDRGLKQSCKETRKATQQEKRLKMVDACDRIKDGVMSGSWLWQGDLRDVYHLRKNLLRASLDLVNLKVPNSLNEQTILLIPAVSYSLTAGCCHLLPFYKEKSIFADARVGKAMVNSATLSHSFDFLLLCLLFT